MARLIIVCRSTLSAPSADAYTIISTNIVITKWRDHALRAAKPYPIKAIRQPHHRNERGGDVRPFQVSHFFAAPMRCGPMGRIASAIETNIPTDASAANQLKIRTPKGCFI